MSKPAKRRRRHSLLRSPNKPIGAAPGTIVQVPGALPTQIEVIGYDRERIVTTRCNSPEELREMLKQWRVVWVNVIGLRDTAKIEELAKVFNLHPLALEDVFNLHQRAKVELYDRQYFTVARSFTFENEELLAEQLCFFLGKNFVVMIQERPGDCFGPIRERLKNSSSRLRNEGADHLLYALLDLLVDSYYPLLEQLGERLDSIEDTILENVSRVSLGHMRTAKRDLLLLRRHIWPLREAIAALEHAEGEPITPETRLFLRDCYDHTIQLIDVLENYRELAGSLLDIYLSAIANRSAEIARVLTVVATIFIPLTFIVGIYGMNFNTAASPWNMPELNWAWGYPAVMMGMLIIALSLLFVFWRRGWLRSADKSGE